MFFLFLNVKESYSIAEIELYERTLLGREGVGPHIVANLAKILDAAGAPEAVPWTHKVIGLRCLKEVGDADAIGLLERLAKDTRSFEHVATDVEYDPGTGEETGRSEERREVPFAELAAEALEAVRARE